MHFIPSLYLISFVKELATIAEFDAIEIVTDYNTRNRDFPKGQSEKKAGLTASLAKPKVLFARHLSERREEVCRLFSKIKNQK